ncbi:MAG TPA: flagellar basal body L-ring protein FlgH [Allosphingosinicella sp.]
MAAIPGVAAAEDLYPHDKWAALVGDRRAEQVGDVLTVVVFENSVAANSAKSGTRRDTSISGEISAGSGLDESGKLAFGGRYEGAGETTRAGRMVATISVVVEAVLPNGDLRIAGSQMLKINGERTFIRIRGRVRAADIRDNQVLSSRLAEAEIDYDGSGFITRSTKPGLIARIFNFLGIL